MNFTGNATANKVLRGRISKLETLCINAYEIAVKNGFEGTEEEWLESLVPSGDIEELQKTARKHEIKLNDHQTVIADHTSRLDNLEASGGGSGGSGAPGKDGVSCTHEWNGTVLSVTSASGTSSADLKGERGSAGVHVGSEEPTDPDVKLWFNPEGEAGGPVNDYELPVAAADTLGGVQPMAKTEDMTQPVGVDEYGALWSVGSDGGASEWKLLGEVTITEEVSVVAFSKFQVDDIYLFTKGLKTQKESSMGAYIKFNAFSKTTLYKNNVFNSITDHAGRLLMIEVGDGYKFGVVSNQPDQVGNRPEMITFFGNKYDKVGKITRIEITPSETSYPFTGGIVRLYGR
jgi:hypothetical protein